MSGLPHHQLPYLTADIPGIGGMIKAEPEDFAVEERPLYLPCGEGEHVYLRVTKRKLATPDLVSYLSSRLGIKARAIGVAGLKDAQALTTQMVSLQGVAPESIPALEHPGILAVEILGRHRNRLRMGHHRGNTFRVTVRHLHPTAPESAPLILERLRTRGVPNYFGPQRQGLKGQNYLLGAELLRDPSKRARFTKRKRMWYLNAYQAHVFNVVLSRRIGTLDRVLVGDWAMKHENGACFPVEDAEAAQPRADRFEISPTGPLFGSRSPWASGEPGELELAAVASLGQTREGLRAAAAACGVRGERRTLRVPLADLEWAFGDDPRTLTLSFTLPPGAYATVVLRELMKHGGEPRRAGARAGARVGN